MNKEAFYFPITREEFLKLNLPPRFKLWAEDRELEDYMLTLAFAPKPIPKNVPLAQGDVKVAVIGSGPAGLGCADELIKLGFKVTVFEREDRAGGLLIYGIPQIKLPKEIVSARIQALQAAGVEFRLSTAVGRDIHLHDLQKDFAAIVICAGSTEPRKLKLEGNELKSVYQAKDFLTSMTRSLLDNNLAPGTFLSARDKDVVIIGGGDTGTDCAALALAQGAHSIRQLEVQSCDAARISQPGFCELVEGDQTLAYTTQAKRLVGNENGEVAGAEVCRVEWERSEGGLPQRREVPGTTMLLPTQLVLLAIGFNGPEAWVFEEFGLKKTPAGTVATNSGTFATSADGIFAAGDARRGAGVVDWAVTEGRGAARECAYYLNKIK